MTPAGMTNYWLHQARSILDAPGESAAIAAVLFLGNALRCWLLEIAPQLPVANPLGLPQVLASEAAGGREFTQLHRLLHRPDSWLAQLVRAYSSSLSVQDARDASVLASSAGSWSGEDCRAWLGELQQCISSGREGLVHD